MTFVDAGPHKSPHIIMMKVLKQTLMFPIRTQKKELHLMKSPYKGRAIRTFFQIISKKA